MKSAVRAASLLALSVLSLALLPGCGSEIQTDKVQKNLTEAQYYAQLNQTTQARQWADRAIAVNPNALSTYVATTSDASGGDQSLTIAQVFEGAGDDPTLVSYMQQAAQKHPDAYQPLQTLEDAQGRLGDLAGQRATATKLAALLEKKTVAPGAHDKTLMLALAQAYCDAGNLTKGAADYQAVINTSPHDPVPENGLAYSYAVADSVPDLSQARALAQQALADAISAKEPEEYIGAVQDTLGWVQYRQGDLADALSNIQAAVNIDPRQAEERYHLGMVYKALHKPDAARAEFTHAALLSQGYKAPQVELSRLKTPAKPAPTETAQR